MGKILPVVVILLFIGIALSSSINASIIQDDLVDIEVELCVIGKKHTVQLTQQEADNVELLFDDIEQRLSEVQSRVETIPIYKNAITELNTYGLLPTGMSIEEGQKLVVDGYSKEQELLFVKKNSHENSLQENQHNFCCFVAGVVQDGYTTGILGMIGMILQIFTIMGFPFIFALMGGVIMKISEIFVTVFPFSIMKSITLFSANIASLGLLGFINHTLPPHSGTGKIFGFNGIKLTNIETGEIKLLGFALAVIDFSND